MGRISLCASRYVICTGIYMCTLNVDILVLLYFHVLSPGRHFHVDKSLDPCKMQEYMLCTKTSTHTRLTQSVGAESRWTKF